MSPVFALNPGEKIWMKRWRWYFSTYIGALLSLCQIQLQRKYTKIQLVRNTGIKRMMLLLDTLESKYGGDPDKYWKERWLPHLTHIVGVLPAFLCQIQIQIQIATNTGKIRCSYLTHIAGVLLAFLHQAATWRGWSTAGGRGGNRLTWDMNLRLGGTSALVELM